MQCVQRPETASWKLAKTLAAIALAVNVSACAGQTGDQPLTPAQAQLQQENKHFAATVGEGALVGALGGALIGYLAGGSRGAIIGAAAGGVAGGATGYAVAHNNLSHAHTEADLQKAIQEANADAGAYERSAAASAQIAADFREQAAELQARYKTGAISYAQYQSRIASYRSSADTMRKQLSSMQSESVAWHADASAYGSPDLNQAAMRIDAARHREAQSLQSLDQALSAVSG
jgi:uncharacterized membrane protein